MKNLRYLLNTVTGLEKLKDKKWLLLQEEVFEIRYVKCTMNISGVFSGMNFYQSCNA